jgi:hypothetical protein
MTFARGSVILVTETREIDRDPSGDPQIQLRLDQYKAYLDDLGNIGTRYTTANGFYVSIVSALLAILALAEKGEAFASFDVLLYIVVPIFACLLCLVWWESMKSYSGLFKRKFDVLREMEKQQLPFAPFLREEELRKENLPRSGPRMIKNDEWIPLILATPFAAVFSMDCGWPAGNEISISPIRRLPRNHRPFPEQPCLGGNDVGIFFGKETLALVDSPNSRELRQDAGEIVRIPR